MQQHFRIDLTLQIRVTVVTSQLALANFWFMVNRNRSTSEKRRRSKEALSAADKCLYGSVCISISISSLFRNRTEDPKYQRAADLGCIGCAVESVNEL